MTSTDHTVEVSFVLANPSDGSRFFIHCPSIKERDSPPHTLEPVTDCFVYRARPGEPSLYLLSYPCPPSFCSKKVSLLPCGDGEHYSVVIPAERFNAGAWTDDLHVFSSKAMAWSTKVAQVAGDKETYYGELAAHQTSKVMALGGGSLGLVDLQLSVLLCRRQPRYAFGPMHVPMPSNKMYFAKRAFRDVTCSSNGLIRFVEIE